jgi:hypothetical protein
VVLQMTDSIHYLLINLSFDDIQFELLTDSLHKPQIKIDWFMQRRYQKGIGQTRAARFMTFCGTEEYGNTQNDIV